MKHILFVCIENSCRSQMAEAFAKMHAPDNIKIYSSGSKPSGQVNPRAVQFMAELNYDLNQHDSKSLDEIPDVEYEFAITMGCGDECPFVRAKQRLDWGIDDPKHASDEEFRKIRDHIEQCVIELLKDISE